MVQKMAKLSVFEIFQGIYATSPLQQRVQLSHCIAIPARQFIPHRFNFFNAPFIPDSCLFFVVNGKGKTLKHLKAVKKSIVKRADERKWQ